MLAKRNRLTVAAFDEAYTKGRRLHHPLLQMVYQEGVEFHGAVVVGKKVHQKAVDRNRLRRQLYGVLYRAYKTKQLTGTYLILVKPSAKNASAADRQAAVESLITSTIKQ